MAVAAVLAILTECGCLVAGMPGDLLRMQTADYRTFGDRHGFVLAFHPSPDEGGGPLHVIAGNVAQGRWTHVTLPASDKEAPAYRRGQVREIRRSRGLILIEQEVAIDAVAVSILAPDLTRLGAIAAYNGLNGYYTLPNGLLAYRGAQPHFAPTHWVELHVIDTRSGRQRRVYPTKPYDRVRLEAIARANTEWFNSDLWYETPPVIDEGTQALAFGVTYGEDAGVEAIVACDGLRSLTTIVCRETPHASWQRRYPTEPRQRILERAAASPRRTFRQ